MRRALAGLIAVACLAACNETPTSLDVGAALDQISESAVPLATLAPGPMTADLAAFKTMVGSARVIGLGEATHGSSEFFTMKDRLFRFLVEQHGVTGFAIEATMPEAFAIDTYVRTGVGNPEVLLSHLYFWTWNTQEVADLIAWLRAWNEQHPDKQVGFYGFDMQYPGIAIDSVTSYLGRVAPDLAGMVSADYSCLAEYRNNDRGKALRNYSQAGGVVWQACGPSIAAAHTRLTQQRNTLVAASSEREFELALQMARVVVQWEVKSRLNSSLARDASMAENVEWLLDREGPQGKLFLWAHNYHISRVPGSMGDLLAQAYDDDYVPVGFAFAAAGLNAVEGIGNGTFGPLRAFVTPTPSITSYEYVLEQVESPNYYLDMRAATGDAQTWLMGPRSLRSVGSVYFPQIPGVHYTSASLRTQFDILIFIESAVPSLLLPFQF